MRGVGWGGVEVNASTRTAAKDATTGTLERDPILPHPMLDSSLELIQSDVYYLQQQTQNNPNKNSEGVWVAVRDHSSHVPPL